MLLVEPTVMGSSPYDRFCWLASLLDSPLTLGIRLRFAFLRYSADLLVAGTDEQNDLALTQEHYLAAVGLLLVIRVGVTAD